MRVALVVGARPQFIKAAPLLDQLRATPGVEPLLVHSGQHFDENMSAVFFRELGLPTPDFSLSIHSGSHGQMTGRMLEAIESCLISSRAERVVVFGDTNTTLAGALAAAKLQIPVAHVEAGLRSWNRTMPEEINRVQVDHCSTWLFCPTGQAVAGQIPGAPVLTGQGLLDALPTDGLKAAAEPFKDGTPLWFYILAEAGANGGRLGVVGSTIVIETLHALAEATGLPLPQGPVSAPSGRLIDLLKLSGNIP